MILTKIAEKYLADWLTPVSQEQDEKALNMIAQINGIACLFALPAVFVQLSLDSFTGIALLILLPQLVVLNLANTLAVAGKRRSDSKVLPKEFFIALLSTTLMYVDLFMLVSLLVKLSK